MPYKLQVVNSMRCHRLTLSNPQDIIGLLQAQEENLKTLLEWDIPTYNEGPLLPDTMFNTRGFTKGKE